MKHGPTFENHQCFLPGSKHSADSWIHGAFSTLYLGVLHPEETYFGLRGAYYPVKVAILQGLTVTVQAFGKISLLGGLVTFAQEEQDATAILWLSVGFWAFFALLCWNSFYPVLLLMFPDTAWARIGAAVMDAALDLGYILTYLGVASWFKFGFISSIDLQGLIHRWRSGKANPSLLQGFGGHAEIADNFRRMGEFWR